MFPGHKAPSSLRGAILVWLVGLYLLSVSGDFVVSKRDLLTLIYAMLWARSWMGKRYPACRGRLRLPEPRAGRSAVRFVEDRLFQTSISAFGKVETRLCQVAPTKTTRRNQCLLLGWARPVQVRHIPLRSWVNFT